MAKLQDYMKDGRGNLSSQRLKSFQMMWFFFILNTFFVTFFFFLAYQGESMKEIMPYFIMFTLSLDFMLLLAIYAPQHLSKISEVKEVIELAKIDKSKPE